jgi:hypothetical protein
VGYPLTDESGCADGVGRYNHFQNGSIFLSPNTGAHEVHGMIGAHWASMGYERSRYGYPIQDETNAEIPGDRMQLFQNGEIHWELTVYGDLVLTVYKVDAHTVGFTWNFWNDPNPGFDGFLVSAHPTGTYTQEDVGGGGYSGAYFITAFAGNTYSFSIDAYFNGAWFFPNNYTGWFDPLIWTMT